MSYSNYSNTSDKEKIFKTVKEKRHYVQRNKGKGDSRGLINNASEMTVEQHFKNTGSGGSLSTYSSIPRNIFKKIEAK